MELYKASVKGAIALAASSAFADSDWKRPWQVKNSVLVLCMLFERMVPLPNGFGLPELLPSNIDISNADSFCAPPVFVFLLMTALVVCAQDGTQDIGDGDGGTENAAAENVPGVGSDSSIASLLSSGSGVVNSITARLEGLLIAIRTAMNGLLAGSGLASLGSRATDLATQLQFGNRVNDQQ